MKIPNDILSLIEGVYRKNDYAILKKVMWSNTKGIYDELIALFPPYNVLNLTDYNYDYCFTYQIISTKNPSSSILTTKDFENAVREEGAIEVIHLKISRILPYFMLVFQSHRVVDDITIAVHNLEKPEIFPAKSFDQLLQFLYQKGLKYLTSEIANIIIPDVETELTKIGEATVKDCVFG